jgi:hypothetical protein
LLAGGAATAAVLAARTITVPHRPGVAAALGHGVAAAVVAVAVFVLIAYLVDRRDVRPALGAALRRVRAGRGEIVSEERACEPRSEREVER